MTGPSEFIVDGTQTPVNITVAVDGSSTDPAYTVLSPQNVGVTVQDNDSAGVTILPSGGTMVTETSLDTYTVRLTSEPLGTVTVTVTSTDTSHGDATRTRNFLNAIAHDEPLICSLEDGIRTSELLHALWDSHTLEIRVPVHRVGKIG